MYSQGPSILLQLDFNNYEIAMEDISYSILSFDNQTSLDSVFMPPEHAFLSTMTPRLDLASVLAIISHIFTISALWKLLLIILIVGNLKALPLMWHVRVPIFFQRRCQLTIIPDASRERFSIRFALSAVHSEPDVGSNIPAPYYKFLRTIGRNRFQYSQYAPVPPCFSPCNIIKAR